MRLHIRLFIILLILNFISSPQSAEAAGYGTQFTTSVTYMNIGTANATISFQFYSEGANSVTTTHDVAVLAPNAAASLYIGSVFTSSFNGSAIMVSNQPLVATMVQLPTGSTTVRNRPLANGISNGASPVLIGTVLKNKFSSNSILSVQNAGSSAGDVTVEFIHSTDGNDFTDTVNLSPGAAKYYDMGSVSEVGNVFNGSARLSSTVPLVATVLELSLVKDAVYAFEGITDGATTLFMPSALCKFGPEVTTSAYAVQNTSSTSSTKISVAFTGTANGVPTNATLDPITIAPGAKASVSGCGDAAHVLADKFLGSAVITSISVDGGTTPPQDIIAIGKIGGFGAFVTAFEGVAQGAEKLALPYVRYSDIFAAYTSNPVVQRTNIAIQNVGTTIPAGQVSVDFVGPNGTVLGTYTYPKELPNGGKFSVNPKMAGLPEFGYVPNPSTGKPISYGGGAIVHGPAGSSLAAVARVSSNTSAGDVAEDYNGIPVE